MYSPTTSLNGAKLLLNKGPARKVTIEDVASSLVAPAIITPHALPMFRDGDGLMGASKRKREKDRMDPRKSRRPDLPVSGPGKGGRVGASATQHLVQHLVRDTTRDEDVSQGHVDSRFVYPLIDCSSREKHCSNTLRPASLTHNGQQVSRLFIVVLVWLLIV